MSQKNRNKNLQWLNGIITFVFDHEEEFLKRFYNSYRYLELLEFYMASERCRVTFMISTGETVTDTIKTNDLFNWMDEIR